MRCPACGHDDSKVVDSRDSADAIRRRRECLQCGERFTTFERLEERPLWILKKHGEKEPFLREKVASGIQLACRKRPYGPEELEAVVDRVVRRLEDRKEPVISSAAVGETVMDVLREFDEVAYVRFASVYGAFASVDQFLATIGPLRERS